MRCNGEQYKGMLLSQTDWKKNNVIKHWDSWEHNPKSNVLYNRTQTRRHLPRARMSCKSIYRYVTLGKQVNMLI